MKKFLIAILAFIYLSTSLGATVHLHYCMNKLVDWSLSNNKSGKCGNCGMEKSQEKDNGCCKDEQKQVKLENDQKAASGYQVTQLLSVTIIDSFFELPLVNPPSIIEENPISRAPPRSGTLAIYIRDCVFRI